MVLFLSLTGIFLSIILLIFNARKYKSSLLLGGFFFLISLYAFTQWVFTDSHSVLLWSIFYIHPASLYYLSGPVLLWYFRSVLNDRITFRKRDLWHLLPAALFLLSTIPYLLLPPDVKTSNAAMLAADFTNLRHIRASILYDYIHPGLIYLSRPLLLLGYTIWAVGLFLRFMVRRQNRSVFSHQRYMLYWLILLLVFVFLLTAGNLTAMAEAYRLQDLRVYMTQNLLHLISGIGLTGLLISLLLFPTILYGMPRIPKTSPGHQLLTSVSQSAAISGTATADSLPKQGFEAEYLQQIGLSVDNCMEHSKPYLQHDCNLAHMAKLTAIPAHHLAYYFREVKKQPFTDYRNIWRIRHATELIREGKTKEFTLEAIGLLSGFSTRNTFYTAFKKVAGASPRSYVAETMEQDH